MKDIADFIWNAPGEKAIAAVLLLAVVVGIIKDIIFDK